MGTDRAAHAGKVSVWPSARDQNARNALPFISHKREWLPIESLREVYAGDDFPPRRLVREWQLHANPLDVKAFTVKPGDSVEIDEPHVVTTASERVVNLSSLLAEPPQRADHVLDLDDACAADRERGEETGPLQRLDGEAPRLPRRGFCSTAPTPAMPNKLTLIQCWTVGM